MAFTCSFCKFRTFEEKEIESHLESAAHQETLDHIQKQTKFDKVVMEFLHVSHMLAFKNKLYYLLPSEHVYFFIKILHFERVST